MLDKLLSVVASNAKLVVAGAVGAALVAGGGAVAVTQVSQSTTGTDHANARSIAQGDNSASDTATAKAALPKPTETEAADANDANDGAQGVHGACVSAVAQATPAPDASPGDHGKAVSAAAHSCSTGNATADAARKAAADRKAAGQAHKTAHTTGRPANAGTHATDDASEAPDTASTDGGGHGKSGQTHP